MRPGRVVAVSYSLRREPASCQPYQPPTLQPPSPHLLAQQLLAVHLLVAARRLNLTQFSVHVRHAAPARRRGRGALLQGRNLGRRAAPGVAAIWGAAVRQSNSPGVGHAPAWTAASAA